MQNLTRTAKISFGALGCLSLGATGGILAARWTQTDAADYLSFLGSILGSAIAIIGAFVLVHFQRNVERQEARRHLADVVEQVIDASRTITDPLPPLSDREQVVERLPSIMEALANLEWCAVELGDEQLNRDAGFMFDLRHLRRSMQAVTLHITLVKDGVRIATAGPPEIIRAHNQLSGPIRKLGERANAAKLAITV